MPSAKRFLIVRNNWHLLLIKNDLELKIKSLKPISPKGNTQRSAICQLTKSRRQNAKGYRDATAFLQPMCG